MKDDLKRKIKIISLTHAEDIDGIGSQSIIYRYFTILNKPLPEKFGIQKDEDLEIELVRLQTDYDNYLYIWAAIFAQNLKRISLFKNKLSDVKLNFLDKWAYIYQLIDQEQTKPPNSDKGEIKFLDSMNDKIKNHILQTSNTLRDVDLIILSDLGMNANFKPIFNILENSKLKIVYFDHHEHFQEAKEFFSKFAKVYEVEDKYCTAELVRDSLLQDDLVSLKIAELARDSDFQVNKISLSNTIQAILGTYWDDYDILEQIEELLSHGQFESPFFDKYFSIVKKIEEKEEEYLVKHNYFKEISAKGLKTYIITGFSKLKASRNTKLIEKNFNKITNEKAHFDEFNFIFMGIDLNTGKVNIRSNKFNVYNIANHFEGGGHIERAGFKIHKKYLKEKTNSDYCLQNILIEKFINDIINLLNAE